MMTFEEFRKDCPLLTEQEMCDIWQAKCQCDIKNCPSFHVYRKLVKSVDKLKNHCHYHEYIEHGLNVSKPARKVTFEEEK